MAGWGGPPEAHVLRAHSGGPVSRMERVWVSLPSMAAWRPGAALLPEPGTRLHREHGLTPASRLGCVSLPCAPCTPPPALLGLPLQVVVEGPRSSTELLNLTSSTEYVVSVFPIYEAGAGEGLRGLVTTGGWGRGAWAQGSGLPTPSQTPLGAWHQEGWCSGQL